MGYQNLDRFLVQNFFESGPEAVEVRLVENLSASKSGFFDFQLEFLP